MRARNLWIVALLSLGLGAFGCTLDDVDTGAADSSGNRAAEQSVTLQPVFELQGLEELPNGIHLDELHLGVGAIFLELVESEDGIAFANRTPFPLHFYVSDGQLTASAPPMVLPQGGRYQVSVQVEPQALLANRESIEGIRSLDTPGAEASLIAGGRIVETAFTDNGDDDDEPAPLPWRPDLSSIGSLQADTSVVPFSVTSHRTVRFFLDEVELVGGSETVLNMQLQVGSWIDETLRPALYDALGERADGQPSTDRLEGVDIDLGERLEEDEDGMDALIGGMKIEPQ